MTELLHDFSLSCVSLYRGNHIPYVIMGVVGCGEGVVYLTSSGVQLIVVYSWRRPAILVAGKGRGGMFLFLLFLHFHSCSSFSPVHFSSPILILLSSPFLWGTQNDPQGLTCRYTPTPSSPCITVHQFTIGVTTPTA